MPADAPERASLYETDVLQLAYDICAPEAAEASNQPDLLLLRGLLLARRPGHAAAALACVVRALVLEPSCGELWRALATLLSQAGWPRAALSATLCAVKCAPDGTTFAQLGSVLHRLGLLREAQAVYERALEHLPHDSSIYWELADVLCNRARYRASLATCEAGLRLEPRAPRGYHRLGLTYLSNSQHIEALACFRTALQLDPLAPDLHVGEGRALSASGDWRAALQSFRTALACDPLNEPASRHLVHALSKLSNIDDELARALSHLGMLQTSLMRYEEAHDTFRQAVTMDGDARALAGLAHACVATARPREALSPARAAVSKTPADLAVRIDLATAHHLLGELETGWDEFSWACDVHTSWRRGFDGPLWDGSPLNGRTILLWTDMGRGDVIQFLRYVPHIKLLGGTVVVVCHHAGLRPLIVRVAGVDRVIDSRRPLPHYDVHAPLNLLPAYIRRYRAVDAHVPYLSVDPQLRERWQRRLGASASQTIGLSWGGNATTISASSRFLSLRACMPLGTVPATRYVSLQHGPQTAELLALPAGFTVERVLDENSSIADAAALVSLVELVISVDTMIAHLAGALGRPVWTLLRYATNWRWQATGTTTAWYPTMRLFRQPRDGDWSSVIDDVRSALDVRRTAPCDD